MSYVAADADYKSSKLFLEHLAATAACPCVPSSRLLVHRTQQVFSFSNGNRSNSTLLSYAVKGIFDFWRNADHHARFFSQRASSASFLVAGQVSTTVAPDTRSASN